MLKYIKKIIVSVLALTLISISTTSGTAETVPVDIDYENMEADGTINGEIIDWDLYEIAHPDCNDQCNSPDFPTMRSVIEARDNYWKNKNSK